MALITMFLLVAVVFVLLLAVFISAANLFRGHFLNFVAALLSAAALAFFVKTLVKKSGRQYVNNPALPINASNKKSI